MVPHFAIYRTKMEVPWIWGGCWVFNDCGGMPLLMALGHDTCRFCIRRILRPVGSHRHHWTPCPWVCVFEAWVGVHIDEKLNDDGMHMCPHILHGASWNGLLLRGSWAMKLSHVVFWVLLQSYFQFVPKKKKKKKLSHARGHFTMVTFPWYDV